MLKIFENFENYDARQMRVTRLPIELSVDSSKVNKKACIKENVLYIQVFNAGVTFTRERS